MRILWAAGLAVLVTACDQGGAKKVEEVADKPLSANARPMLGVRPDKFDCAAFLPEADLGALLGGTVRPAESRLPVPKNVAKPCGYELSIGAGDAGTAESWSYDFDCRPDYEKRAELLFADYLRKNADLMEAYAKAHPDGKPTINDAGVTLNAPGASKEVAVGRRAIDHHGQSIVFIDDDAPCYVRINGPGADRRLMLAKLVSERLHEANAPMEPHLGPKP